MMSFFIAGVPQPAGSKRAFAIRGKDGNIVKRASGADMIAVTDANPKAKPWQAIVRADAHIVMARQTRGPRAGAIRLELFFVLKRPKSHYRTGKRANELHDWAVKLQPIGKPDVLKLARAVEDACTGIIWLDDAQITEEFLRKRYAAHGESTGVEVHVRSMDW